MNTFLLLYFLAMPVVFSVLVWGTRTGGWLEDEPQTPADRVGMVLTLTCVWPVVLAVIIVGGILVGVFEALKWLLQEIAP